MMRIITDALQLRKRKTNYRNMQMMWIFFRPQIEASQHHALASLYRIPFGWGLNKRLCVYYFRVNERNTTYWVLVCSLLIEFLGIKVPVH